MFCTTNYQFPHATVPITSGCIGVFAITVAIACSLFVCALEHLVRFFKLCDHCGQLRVAIVLLVQCSSIEQIALHAFPCEGLFWSPVFLILTALHCVMGVVHAPMLLA